MTNDVDFFTTSSAYANTAELSSTSLGLFGSRRLSEQGWGTEVFRDAPVYTKDGDRVIPSAYLVLMKTGRRAGRLTKAI